MTLETARLRLEPWAEEHLALLVRWSALPEVMRFIGAGTTWTPERARESHERALAHWAQRGFGWRAMVDRATGEAVGLASLNRLGDGFAGVSPDEHEIGWWVDPGHWGRGIAREGGAAVRDEAFVRLGAPSVVANVLPANAASLRVCAALGLTPFAECAGRTGEPVVVLRRERGVRLEPWGDGDADLLARLVGDPAMMEHLGGAESPEQIAVRQRRYAQPGSGMYVVVDERTGERAGSVGFWPRGDDAYETGWSILPSHQGRGLAQAATREVVELARRAGDRRWLCAYPNVANGASNAICERLGFELLGAEDFEYPKGHPMRCNAWRLDLR